MSYTVFVISLSAGAGLTFFLACVKVLSRHPRPDKATRRDWVDRLSWFAVPLPILLAVAWVSWPYIQSVLSWQSLNH